MKRIVSLLLALMLVVSLIPMTVSAAKVSVYEIETVTEGSNGNYIGIKYDGTKVGLTKAEYAAVLAYWKSLCPTEPPYHDPGKHEYTTKYNNKYHWLGCPCGCQISMEPHVDPKDAENDYCTCGFHFSSNADLVTLWVAGCPCIKDFNKNTTEYTLKAYTYKDVKKVKISTRTADSQATVELPEDLTLKEGENIIPVKVTAGNQRDTKTYTLTIIKESK